MVETPDIRRADATITGASFETVHIASVTVNMSLNEAPTYSVTPVPNRDKDKIVGRVTDVDLVRYYGRLQSAKTSPPAVNSIKLSLFDGLAPYLDADVLFISPETTLGAASYAIMLNFVGELALLDSFRPDVYDSFEFGQYFGTAPGKENREIQRLVSNVTTPADYLRVTLNEMIKLWGVATNTGTKNPTYRDEDAALIKRIHDNNIVPKSLLDSILNLSGSASPAFKLLSRAAVSVKLPVQMHVVRILADMLRHSTGGFMQTLLYFAYTFDLVMVPDINGRTARFVSTDDLVNSDPVVKEVTIVNFTPKLGRSTLSPVNAVVVRGSMQSGYKAGIQSGTRTLSDSGLILGVWPPQALSSANSGIPTTVAPPAWVPPNAPPSSLTRKNIKRSLAGDRPSPETIRKEQELGLKSYGDLCGEIMTATAKSRYIDTALQSDTVTITVPLDYSWQLGVRYSIRGKTRDGAEVLFTGAAASLAHRLERPQNPGSDGVMVTTLTFSHVEMGAYTLIDKT
jgi:hypothetical protein